MVCDFIVSITCSCHKASQVRDAVHKLITKTVVITQYTSCSCLHAQWRRGVPPLCSLHRPGHQTTQHDCVVRQVIQIVCHVDVDAAVLPSFGMKAHGVSKRGGPAFHLDVLFVLCNSMLVAVEVDGRSHKNARNRKHDTLKENKLSRCGVRLFRIDLSQSIPDQLYEIEHMIKGLV